DKLVEYADDAVPLGKDVDRKQLFLTASSIVYTFEKQLSPFKRKMLLQDWLKSVPKSVIGSEVDLISPDGLTSDEVSTRIQKVQLAFHNLRHWWRRRDICLPTKGRIYCAAV
ncbi:endonuclease-reverse transcriptase, partial [Schistosoma japonicum]